MNKLGDPADKGVDTFNSNHRSGYTIGSLDYIIDRVRKGHDISRSEAARLVEHIDMLKTELKIN